MAGQAQIIEILMVEDDDGDILLTKAALAESKIRNSLHVCHDGEEAMQFLRREGKYEDAPRPDLILLDLNMPRMNGHETLAAIRADPDLHTLPVVILTTSDHDADVAESYKLHVNAYVRKPVDLEQFINVVQHIEQFWLGIVRLPKRID